MTTQIALRLPDDLLQALDELVPASHGSRSEVVRRAIELYVYRMRCERDAAAYDALPLTDAELALAAPADGWTATPRW